MLGSYKKYQRRKHGCNEKVIQGALHKGQCQFLMLSLPPLEGFSIEIISETLPTFHVLTLKFIAIFWRENVKEGDYFESQL